MLTTLVRHPGFSRLIWLSLLCCFNVFNPAVCDPLQGYVQEKTKAHRLKQSAQNDSGQLEEAQIDQSKFTGHATTGKDKAGKTLPGAAGGSQEEYWIDWQSWSDRIGQRVWPLLAGRVMPAAGEIRYNITSDGRIILLSAKGSPETVQILLKAVMTLQGDPVLKFPEGTSLTEHSRITAVQAGMQRAAERQYWGSEHVIRRWYQPE